MTPCSEAKFRFVGGALIALAAFAAFAPALRTGYVYDDFTVVTENTELPSLLKVSSYFSFDYFRYSGETTYRPLVSASYALDYARWGKKAFGYHLTNLLWHSAACVFFFLTCLSFRASREVSLVAALIYSIHPLRSEGVTGIGFREDVMCAAFYMAALAAWPSALFAATNAPRRNPETGGARKKGGKTARLRKAERASSRRAASVAATSAVRLPRLALSLSLFAMALLSKEMALSFPLMALAKELRLKRLSPAHAPFDWKPLVLRQVAVWLATFVALAIYLGFTAPNAPVATARAAGLIARLAAFAWICVRYIRLFLVPYPLCIEYAVEMHGELFWLSALGAVAVFLLLATLAVRLYRRFPEGAESLLAFFVLLGPVSNLIPIFNPMAERYLTIPTAAFAWLAAHCIFRIPRRAVRWGLTALLAAAYASLSWLRLEDWRDSTQLWRGAIQAGNESSRTLNNLGRQLYEEGRIDEALNAYYRAIEADPQYREARINIGAALYDKGKFREAIENYEIALRAYPNPKVGDVVPAMLHNNIANAFYRAGELEKAPYHYDRALKILPHMREPHNNWGSILAQLGRPEEAIPHYKKAIANDRYWEVPYRNLGLVLAGLGRLDEAIAQYRAALTIKPGYVEARLDLARALVAANRRAEAVDEYRTVLRFAPNHPDALKQIQALSGGSGGGGQ